MADDADEHALIKRAAAGDESAFTVLVDRHASAVLRLATSRLGDAAAATEVAQDALVRLYWSLSTIRGDATLRTWLVRVTINLCADVARRRRRSVRLLPIEAADAVVPDAIADPVEVADDASRLRAAIAALPESLRNVVELRYDAELSYREISATLCIPIGTVSSRLAAALKALRAASAPLQSTL